MRFVAITNISNAFMVRELQLSYVYESRQQRQQAGGVPFEDPHDLAPNPYEMAHAEASVVVAHGIAIERSAIERRGGQWGPQNQRWAEAFEITEHALADRKALTEQIAATEDEAFLLVRERVAAQPGLDWTEEESEKVTRLVAGANALAWLHEQQVLAQGQIPLPRDAEQALASQRRFIDDSLTELRNPAPTFGERDNPEGGPENGGPEDLGGPGSGTGGTPRPNPPIAGPGGGGQSVPTEPPRSIGDKRAIGEQPARQDPPEPPGPATDRLKGAPPSLSIHTGDSTPTGTGVAKIRRRRLGPARIGGVPVARVQKMRTLAAGKAKATQPSAVPASSRPIGAQAPNAATGNGAAGRRQRSGLRIGNSAGPRTTNAVQTPETPSNGATSIKDPSNTGGRVRGAGNGAANTGRSPTTTTTGGRRRSVRGRPATTAGRSQAISTTTRAPLGRPAVQPVVRGAIGPGGR